MNNGLDRTDDFRRAAQLAGGRNLLPTSDYESSAASSSTAYSSARNLDGMGNSRCSETASGLRQRPKDAMQVPQDNQFQRVANEYSSEITSATSKLERLRKLVKQRGIFKDNAREIEELTYEINQVVTKLNGKLQNLEDTANLAQNRNSQSNAHYVTIIGSLKSRLLEITKSFKEVLQIRTENMKKQDDRRNLYSYAAATQQADGTHFFISSPSESDRFDLESGGAQMQRTAPKGFVYAQSRKEAMENVQRAIGELAQIFQRVATVVSEQEQMVRRIDEDVDHSLYNVREGQTLLLSYYSRISSNRSLIIKIFGIILVFVVLFVVFLT